MEKYLSIITNFGCHGKCPYCIVRENGIKVPKTTLGGLTFEQLKHIHKTGNEIVRVVYVVTKDFTLEQIMNIAMFVADSNEIDELSFRQLVDKGYKVTDYWQDVLKFGHKKLWWYIEQCDYNLYYAENKIYTKFSEIGESNET